MILGPWNYGKRNTFGRIECPPLLDTNSTALGMCFFSLRQRLHVLTVRPSRLRFPFTSTHLQEGELEGNTAIPSWKNQFPQDH